MIHHLDLLHVDAPSPLVARSLARRLCSSRLGHFALEVVLVNLLAFEARCATRVGVTLGSRTVAPLLILGACFVGLVTAHERFAPFDTVETGAVDVGAARVVGRARFVGVCTRRVWGRNLFAHVIVLIDLRALLSLVAARVGRLL